MGVEPGEFGWVGYPWELVLGVIVHPGLEMTRVDKSLTAQMRSGRGFLSHQAHFYQTSHLKRHRDKAVHRPECLLHVKRLTAEILSQTNKPQTPTPN